VDNRQEINLIGGGFQHTNSSTDNSDTVYIKWLKNSNIAPISIYVDYGIMTNVVDKSKKNYGWLSESKTIIGNCYDYCKNNVEKLKNLFITIFTHDVDLANYSKFFTLIQCGVKSTIKQPFIYEKK